MYKPISNVQTNKGKNMSFDSSEAMKDLNKSLHLTMEQQVKLNVLKKQIDQLTPEQAKEYVYELSRQLMIKDNLLKHTTKYGVSG